LQNTHNHLMTKKIAILGSTGSIGQNALRVLESLQIDYELVAITANSSAELLAEQINKWQPKYAAITDDTNYGKLKSLTANTKTKILSGPQSLTDIATLGEVDLVLTAVVGAAGLPATLAAAKAGKTLAIANKEPLVIAGELLTQVAKANNATILPVDSEHCAIFQCLASGKSSEVNKIILTASGGPFRDATREQIENATIEDALAHPTWSMGPKITIDSATMMNKALEVIEAKWLFGVDVEKIDVLIHPESIVHSMVEFVDGSVIAQMGSPDMCHPIQYAFTWPDRQAGITSHLKLDELGQLTFKKPDYENFRALKIGFEVAKIGGTAAVVFNAANEAAVELFLAGAISFVQITELIEMALEKHEVATDFNLEQLLEVDKWAREIIKENCKV